MAKTEFHERWRVPGAKGPHTDTEWRESWEFPDLPMQTTKWESVPRICGC